MAFNVNQQYNAGIKTDFKKCPSDRELVIPEVQGGALWEDDREAD